MEAGRELDALIAEKVMGWKPLPRARDEDMGISTGPEWPWVYDDEFGNVEWSPSTDIAAAWEVVEKLKTHSKAASWGVMIGVMPSGKYQCWLASRDCEAAHVCEWADSAPLAICLAALKALS